MVTLSNENSQTLQTRTRTPTYDDYENEFLRSKVELSNLASVGSSHSDLLQLLLSESCPNNLPYRKIELTDLNDACPELDIPFPIMHTHNLQLTDIIPLDINDICDEEMENHQLLRPSVRLLARFGECRVIVCM